MGDCLAISAFIPCLYYVTANTPLVIVDDLDLVCVTCAKYETNAELIVNSNAPLTRAISLEFLQPVAGRHSQESNFGGRINKQELPPGAPRKWRRHNPISFTVKQLARQITCPSFDCHFVYYIE